MKMHPFSILLVLGLFLTACSGKNQTLASPEPLSSSTTTHASSSSVAIWQGALDSTYVYEYSGTKFVPPAGKSLYIFGQDTAVISDYIDITQSAPLPAGWSTYWGIPDSTGITEVTSTEHSSQFGYQNHAWLHEKINDHAIIHTAMWMVGKWNVSSDTYNGKFDDVIRVFGTWAKSTNRPIYLRIGYEFDGPHNELEPEAYVKAYRHVVNTLREMEVNNIAYVWHSVAAPTWQGYSIEQWYPGDDYVDWFAVSLFGHLYQNMVNSYVLDMLDMAKTHQKPVMIAEAAPIHGFSASGTTDWDAWFANYFGFINKYNIKAFAYINCDWPAYPGFAALGLGWKNSTLQSNPDILQKWNQEITKDQYLKAEGDLFQKLGYNP
jgi:hypothetical protein